MLVFDGLLAFSVALAFGLIQIAITPKVEQAERFVSKSIRKRRDLPDMILTPLTGSTQFPDA